MAFVTPSFANNDEKISNDLQTADKAVKSA